MFSFSLKAKSSHCTSTSMTCPLSWGNLGLVPETNHGGSRICCRCKINVIVIFLQVELHQPQGELSDCLPSSDIYLYQHLGLRAVMLALRCPKFIKALMAFISQLVSILSLVTITLCPAYANVGKFANIIVSDSL